MLSGLTERGSALLSSSRDSSADPRAPFAARSFDYWAARPSSGPWLAEPSGKFAIEKVPDDVDRQAVDVGDTLMTRPQFIERHRAASSVVGGVLARDPPAGDVTVRRGHRASPFIRKRRPT
jgi:hypothetical protein